MQEIDWHKRWTAALLQAQDERERANKAEAEVTRLIEKCDKLRIRLHEYTMAEMVRMSQELGIRL